MDLCTLVNHSQYQKREGRWLINNLKAINYKIISFVYIGGPKKGHLVLHSSSHFSILFGLDFPFNNL